MRRPGLRARVMLAFTAGALLLSAGLATATYTLASRHILDERERTAERGAYFDAAVVRQGLAGGTDDLASVLRALDTGQNRRPLIRRDGRWFARSADEGLTAAIPVALRELVEDDRPAVQLVSVTGQPALVVGVPLSGTGDDFYEVQSLAEIQSTLRTLSGTLAAVAAIATVLAAVASRAVAGRALRPLDDVIAAAQRVSSGDLTARIEGRQDRDLEPLRTAFNQMVQDMSQRWERDRRFAADVSHELRSPLQTLAAASSVLARHEGLDARSAAAAQMVQEETERFSQLVQDLLVLARADTPPELVATDVRRLLEAAAARAGVPVATIDAAADVGSWQLDPVRVEQALVNLLENAQRHGGGVVRLGACREEDELVLTVDDAGPGVPPEERQLIFERFARGRAAHSRGDHGGSGLGLALVAQHAGAHGGSVVVLDRRPSGCRFELRLPGQAS